MAKTSRENDDQEEVVEKCRRPSGRDESHIATGGVGAPSLALFQGCGRQMLELVRNGAGNDRGDVGGRLGGEGAGAVYSQAGLPRASAQTLCRADPRLAPQKAGEKWSKKHQACCQTTVAGANWSQQRLFRLGRVQDENCQACRAKPGSLKHRWWSCPASRVLRQELGQNHIAHRGDAAPDMSLKWSRALVPSPVGRMPKVDPEPNEIDEHGTEEMPEDFFYTGLAATDGAASNSQYKPLRRCGWGAASCNEETGEMQWGRFGRLPFKMQRVLLAELWAVIQVIRFAIPPLTILVDNATVVKGFRRGRRWCIHPSRPHAETWLLAWKLFDEANEGEQKIEIQKQKPTSRRPTCRSKAR